MIGRENSHVLRMALVLEVEGQTKREVEGQTKKGG